MPANNQQSQSPDSKQFTANHLTAKQFTANHTPANNQHSQSPDSKTLHSQSHAS